MERLDELTEAAKQTLEHHDHSVARDSTSSESDIRAAIVAMFISGELAKRDEILLESDRTDLRTGHVLVEVKRRIGVGTDPKPEHLSQLDRYLNDARTKGRGERLGILTDGKYWVLRPSAETGQPLKTASTRTFTLRSAKAAVDWLVWVRDAAELTFSRLPQATSEIVAKAFGTGLMASNEVTELRRLYDDHRARPTIQVKRELWETLLGTALGEVVSETNDIDDLFVRHTYLTAVVGLALQSAFGIDIADISADNPNSLIDGTVFAERTAVRGVIESDFFGWPTEVTGGESWIEALARRVARFDWGSTQIDLGSVLYQSVISANERKRLGEYYTPDWLAEAVVSETVQDPLNQRVLDPACGSGTFLRECVKAFVVEAKAQDVDARDALLSLQNKVIGVDIHPVAVHLARTAWILAARELISEVDGTVKVAVPVFLGDSLQTQANAESLFGQNTAVIVYDPSSGISLEFPRGLVDSGDSFDLLLSRVAMDISEGVDPVHILEWAKQSLDWFESASSADVKMIRSTLEALTRLHEQGRDHIWAYFTRNLVRPIWLSTDAGKVDRIVGNPPWLTYNKTRSTIRDALKKFAKSMYGLWPNQQYVTHSDLAGLFYARCVDLYLRGGGQAAMVMPHSVLLAGQYEPWRTGQWGHVSVDLGAEPWDCETLDPNNFFPVPACVVFASKTQGRGLSRTVIQWHGSPNDPTNIRRAPLTLPKLERQSRYGTRAKQGATIVPRVLFFVQALESATAMLNGFSDVVPMRSSQEKEPWKSLDIPTLKATISDDYIHDVHRGDTIAPFVALPPQRAVIPFKRGSTGVPWTKTNPSVSPVPDIGLWRRWQVMTQTWEANKAAANKLTLVSQIDYRRKLTHQLPAAKTRLLYAASGRPTATILCNSDALIDSSLFWIECRDEPEAHYLAAIINSDRLYHAVRPLMSKGQFGPRHLQKHLWRLNIAEYEPTNPVHQKLAALGAKSAKQAARIVDSLGADVAIDKARKAVRKQFAGSKISAEIEKLVETMI